MTRTDLVDGLRALTDKQFVELFYEAVRGRHIYSEERNIFDAHLVLANAVRYIEEGAHGVGLSNSFVPRRARSGRTTRLSATRTQETATAHEQGTWSLPQQLEELLASDL